MKSVLFSINKPHTDNIKSGAKVSELRTKPPKEQGAYKAFIYETKKYGGCGKVIGEFTAYNKCSYRICMGVPKHLCITGCVSSKDILKYTNNGKKDLSEISISNLIIYDKPKELKEFYRIGKPIICGAEMCEICDYYNYMRVNADEFDYDCDCDRLLENQIPITRPPQSWCYCEEVTE